MTSWNFQKSLTGCLLTVVLSLMTGTLTAAEPLRIAIYSHNATPGKAPPNLVRIFDDSARYTYEVVSPEQIREDVLKRFDLLIMPGGSASKQAAHLEESGRDQVRQFVSDGGGYLGICAGAYLASSHYDWSLHLLNAVVVDREHWARGTGQVQLNMTTPGQQFFHVEAPQIDVFYGQGPLLAPDQKPELPPYLTLAEYASEIAKNGAPAGVMIGTTAIAHSTYGKGRVICFSPHCEFTGGPNDMILKAVDWVGTRNEQPPLAVPAQSESIR